MNNNNTIGIIVVGLIAFLAIVVTGKWLLDSKHGHRHRDDQQPVAAAPATPAAPAPTTPPVAAAPPVIVVPPAPPAYPYHYPQYHRNQHFWAGYNDGWNGLPRRFASPEYNQGYEIGVHDRRLGRHYYYDRYYPPGFNLSLPGFRLNIR